MHIKKLLVVPNCQYIIIINTMSYVMDNCLIDRFDLIRPGKLHLPSRTGVRRIT